MYKQTIKDLNRFALCGLLQFQPKMKNKAAEYLWKKSLKIPKG